MYIFVPNDRKVLLVTKMITESYSTHLNAYSTSKTLDHVAIDVSELMFFHCTSLCM